MTIAEPRDHVPYTSLKIGQAVFYDSRNIGHWAMGEPLVLQHPKETFCCWTACGSQDIPPNGAHYRTATDFVDCPDCLAEAKRQSKELSEQ